MIATPAGSAASDETIRQIITLIARASHDIADVVSLGALAGPLDRASTATAPGDTTNPATTARHILVDHLRQGRVRTLHCAGEPGPIDLDESSAYAVTIEPLEGTPDPHANLPFGTIFSISRSDAQASAPAPIAAGFIHYGPQTNLVLTLGGGVYIFNLDRSARTYRLAAESVTIPEEVREWAIDGTKRGRWPSAISTLIDEHFEDADQPGSTHADMRWTGSLTADAFRILRRGGIYICPLDDQPERGDACPNLRHAAHPIAFIVEQAGGLATTGYERLMKRTVKSADERVAMIFGSRGIVERIERLHALPESMFESSPLFRKRGLFRS